MRRGGRQRRKQEWSCRTGPWVIIKQLVITNICGVMDYESDTFQLKDSIDKGRLVSMIIILLQKRKL